MKVTVGYIRETNSQIYSRPCPSAVKYLFLLSQETLFGHSVEC